MTPDPVGEWMAANGLYPGRYMIDIAKSPEYRRAVFSDMTDGEMGKSLPALCARMLGREKFMGLIGAMRAGG